jgi:hypothetical protein
MGIEYDNKAGLKTDEAQSPIHRRPPQCSKCNIHLLLKKILLSRNIAAANKTGYIKTGLIKRIIHWFKRKLLWQ